MRKGRTLILLVFAGAVATSVPAVAADASLVCVNAGRQYKVGDYACLPACHGRQRYARCDAVAEHASWTYVSDVCPIALLSPAQPQAASLAAADSVMTPLPLNIPLSAISPEIAQKISDLGKPGTRLAAR
jgi:hypothetical protein